MIDQVNEAIRYVLKVVSGLPESQVRPAKQAGGAGGQTDQLITVNIVMARSLGSGGSRYDVVEDDDTVLSEVSESLYEFMASVNFYRIGATSDAAGVVTYGNGSLDLASRIKQLLRMSSNAQMLRTMGLGFHDAGQARDLSGISDKTWESRAQIDLFFNVVNRELVQVPRLVGGSVGLQYQPPSGDPEQIQTIEIEVTP